MNRHSLLAVSLSLLAASAPAQEQTAPAPQLDRFKPLAGTWEVSGTMKESAGDPEIPWTARETQRWVLGGHFMRQDTVIDFGDAMPKLVFINFMGWDREHQRYVSCGAANTGEVSFQEVFFPSDDTMVMVNSGTAAGELVVQRNVVEFTDDSYTFAIESAIGSSPFFTAIEGSAKKTAAVGETLAAEASASMAPPVEEMSLFAKMAGEYDFTGTVVPAPGEPSMEITGHESMALIFGGTVASQTITGSAGPDVPPYEAVGFGGWNPVDMCFDMVAIDNMGSVGKMQMRVVDNKTVVGTMASMMIGQPAVGRTTLILDAQGHIVESFTDAIFSNNEPTRTFSGKYTRTR